MAIMTNVLNSFNTKAVVTTLAFLTAAVGCDQQTKLSEVPEKGTKPFSPATEESIIAAKLSIPFAELNKIANQQTPVSFEKKDRIHYCQKHGPYDPKLGIDLRVDVCLDIDYEINVLRNGNLSISRGPSPDSIWITLPIKFDGAAGFVGDLARLLGLNRKNFNGAITAIAHLTLDIRQDWCPIITISTDFNWNQKAKVEIISGVWIPIDDKLSGPLQDALKNTAESLKASISCDRIKSDVSKIWSTQSFPVSIPSAGNVYINVEPVGLGFSGLNVTDTQVDFALQVKSKIDVSTSAAKGVQKPLPPLERVPVSPGKIALSVPFRVAYEPLVSALSSAVKDKEFSSDTAAGKVSVKINDLIVYPSKDNLVVGVSFKADLPKSLFDTSGWIYLYGRPLVDSTGQVISITNIQFSRILDNDLWNAISAIFKDQIKTKIENTAKVDLAPKFEQAKAAITNELTKAQQQSGVQINLANQKIGIRQIVPADKELMIETVYEAVATATLAPK